ncbi:NCL [Symbiodinium pilosum]|uniref:NCL protein n=1 Tax=Symbiodinium pilosum TaxID=2952 RepID=A0A812LJP8_SYMPI|nr:NCL [Symbiodinium pilosum]
MTVTIIMVMLGYGACPHDGGQINQEIQGRDCQLSAQRFLRTQTTVATSHECLCVLAVLVLSILTINMFVQMTCVIALALSALCCWQCSSGGAGQGFCFVNFYSVSDALQAKNRMLAAGSIIDSRKVAISFAKPQTQEQALESDINARAEQDVIQAQANQALSGVNAEMWSSYMQFCKQEEEKESREKKALLEALEAKKRALALAASAASEAEANGLP